MMGWMIVQDKNIWGSNRHVGYKLLFKKNLWDFNAHVDIMEAEPYLF